MARADFVGSEHGLERLAAGVNNFSKAMRMVLSRNYLTHEKMVKLSRWCNPWGETWLSTSQISYLRTGTLKKAGPQTLDALGQVNLRLAEAAGDKSPAVCALPDFGKIPIQLPEEIFFLRHPESHEPLDSGGLYLVWLGRLIPEGIGAESHISDMEARRLSANISRIVQAWARDNKLTLNEAMEQAITAYGAKEEARRQKLKLVIVGFEVYTGEDLEKELVDLGKMLGIIDAKEPIKETEVRERLYKLSKD